MNKNWTMILVLLFVIFFSVPSLRKKIPIFGRMLGINKKIEYFIPDSDFNKSIKIGEPKVYTGSSSENFTSEECEQLLKEWQPDIDDLNFKNISTANQTYVGITDGRRYITFIYENDMFEGCNILDVFYTNLDEQELKVKKYFDCEKEDCKEYKFKNGKFFYIYETSEKYNILKYFLRKENPSREEPSLTFQILYIVKDMSPFIQNKINSAKQGYGCGTE